MRRTALLGLLLAGCGGNQSSTLDRVESEPAGDNCPTGGIVIYSGIDEDDDGRLDDDEILSTSYVCDGDDGGDGDDGTDGTNGHDTLIDIVPVDPPDPCPNGGVAVHAGDDDDDDGVLDPEEIDDTEYVCDGDDGDGGVVPVLEGSYLIENSLDAALLAGVETITGDLIIYGQLMTTVTLPDLVTIGRDLRVIGNADLTMLTIPGLTSVGNSLEIAGNPVLTGLALPVLQEVGNLVVEGNALTELDGLGALTAAATVRIVGNAALTDIDGLTGLTSVEGLEIAYCPLLPDLQGLSGLTDAGSLSLHDLALLTDLDGLISLTTLDELSLYANPLLSDVSALSALTTLTTLSLSQLPAFTDLAQLSALSNVGAVSMVDLAATEVRLPSLATATSITIETNVALTGIDLPALNAVSGTLLLRGNGALADLALPSLTNVGGMTIEANAALTGIDLPALNAASGTLLLRGNGALADLALPSLTDLGDLTIDDNDALLDLGGFAALESAGDITIGSNEILTAVDLPSLDTSGTIYILYCPALTRVESSVTAIDGAFALSVLPALYFVSLPSLTSMSNASYFVNFSPLVPACHHTTILDQLVANGWTGSGYFDGASPCFDADWCRLQAPVDTTTSPGAPITAYGRFYSTGLTDSGVTNDTHVNVIAGYGYGPDGSNPATSTAWTWTTAIANDGWDGDVAGEPNNDEYQASILAPAAGTYDTAFRFSGDRGRTWLVCDRNAGAGADGAEDGYQTANAGSLNVSGG